MDIYKLPNKITEFAEGKISADSLEQLTLSVISDDSFDKFSSDLQDDIYTLDSRELNQLSIQDMIRLKDDLVEKLKVRFDPSVKQALALLQQQYVSDDGEIDLGETEYWELLDAIKFDRERALRLGFSKLDGQKTYERLFGISLLGQICNPVEAGEEKDAERVIAALSKMIESEKSIPCLVGIADALQFPGMQSAKPALLKLSKYDNDEVRWQATVSLGSVIDYPSSSPELIQRLLELSTDKDEEIRDWATMHLGSLEENTEQIRDALFARLSDERFETVSEALRGLAIKRDKRGFEPLIKRLSGDETMQIDIQAAGIWSDPKLLPYLKLWEDVEKNKDLMDWASKRCDPDKTVRESVNEDWVDLESLGIHIDKTKN